MNPKKFKIGELAKKTQISVETIRFYETHHLLSGSHRAANGYRLYSEDDYRQLCFVLHAKKVGFSLKEIVHLINLQVNNETHTCEEVKSYTRAKIDELEAKIRDLETMKQALSHLHAACCGGAESAKNCSILRSFDDPQLFRIASTENVKS